MFLTGHVCLQVQVFKVKGEVVRVSGGWTPCRRINNFFHLIHHYKGPREMLAGRGYQYLQTILLFLANLFCVGYGRYSSRLSTKKALWWNTAVLIFYVTCVVLKFSKERSCHVILYDVMVLVKNMEDSKFEHLLLIRLFYIFLTHLIQILHISFFSV